MKDDPAIRRLYVELTAHLIDHEIAKFRRGEQAALVSFANVAKLARNVGTELAALGVRAQEPDLPLSFSAPLQPATDEGRGAHGQATQF
jgi:hypothetical protein